MTPNWAPSYDGTVDFQTQNREQVLAASAGIGAAPEAPVAEGEHTMTRRELRALREAEGITAVPTDPTPVVSPYAAAPAQAPATAFPVAPEPVNLVPPPPLVAPAPQTSTRLDSALAEFDALAAGREPIAPSPDAPAPLPGRRAAPQAPQPVAQPEQAPVQQAPVEQAPILQAPIQQAPIQQAPPAEAPQDSLSAFEALFAAPSVAPVAVPEPEPVDPLLSAPAPQGAPALVQPPMASPAPVSAPPTAPGPNSVGHWSTQSDLDEADQVTETTISRSVGAGSGAITTSALVLPSVPERSIAGPMSGSGEILLTGSISLPHSYSATGVHPSRLDESGLDHLLDPGDHQVANTDSMPVRAIKAVSTHTATGAIIAPTKQPGTRGFTILIVAASAMAVVVVGLLVAGLVSGTL